MAKLKDMLNEVAPVIKLDVLQNYFLQIYKFKEIKKKKTLQAVMGEGLSGSGDESYNMGITTDHEKSCASNSSRLDSDAEGPF